MQLSKGDRPGIIVAATELVLQQFKTVHSAVVLPRNWCYNSAKTVHNAVVLPKNWCCNSAHGTHTVQCSAHSIAVTELVLQPGKEYTVQCTQCCCHGFGAFPFFPLGRSRCRGGWPALGFPSVLIHIFYPSKIKIRND